MINLLDGSALGAWHGVALGVLLKAIALLAPLADAPQAVHSVVVTVRAKDTDEPLQGATVRVLLDMTHREMKTDREGHVRIDLSGRTFPDNLSLDVWAPGHVQRRFFFSQKDLRHPKIPPMLKVDLLPGEETLGGKVTDEAGRPVARAKVENLGLSRREEAQGRAGLPR